MGQKINPIVIRPYQHYENNLYYLKNKYLIFLLNLKKLFFNFFYFNNIYINLSNLKFSQQTVQCYFELYFLLFPEFLMNGLNRTILYRKKFFKTKSLAKLHFGQTKLPAALVENTFYDQNNLFLNARFKQYLNFKSIRSSLIKKYLYKYLYSFMSIQVKKYNK